MDDYDDRLKREIKKIQKQSRMEMQSIIYLYDSREDIEDRIGL